MRCGRPQKTWLRIATSEFCEGAGEERILKMPRLCALEMLRGYRAIQKGSTRLSQLKLNPLGAMWLMEPALISGLCSVKWMRVFL